MSPARTVVVTGASGNLGTCLLERLASDDRAGEVRAVARRPPDDDRRASVRWFAADVVDDDLDEVLAGADVVVHLAWRIQPSHDLDGMRATNVEGSRRVFEAAARTGVGAIVHASSVGAYRAGPQAATVDESWPLGGHDDHPYSRQKAEVEALLDGVEARHPDLRVVRMRPALLLGAHAGPELRSYFLPPLGPLRRALRASAVRAVPARFQAVHTPDAAAAFAEAALGDARGAFNLATEDALGGRPLPGVEAPLRLLASATWRLRLQPVDPGWVTLLVRCPLLDAGRARAELGWRPRRSGAGALEAGLAGVRGVDAAPTDALHGR